jgi:hypothetical protein
LALLFNIQEKYDLAEPLYHECLEKRKSILGYLHPATLQSLNHLGLLFNNQGKYDLSESLLIECVKKQKSVLGDTQVISQ